MPLARFVSSLYISARRRILLLRETNLEKLQCENALRSCICIQKNISQFFAFKTIDCVRSKCLLMKITCVFFFRRLPHSNFFMFYVSGWVWWERVILIPIVKKTQSYTILENTLYTYIASYCLIWRVYSTKKKLSKLERQRNVFTITGLSDSLSFNPNHRPPHAQSTKYTCKYIQTLIFFHY